MTAELLDWVCAYLERDDEIIVPVKKMWKDWRATHDAPALEAFTAMVMADERIADMGGLDDSGGAGSLTPEAAAENLRQSEAIGLFAGPLVKLKSREITDENVARMLNRQNERIMAALDQVIEALPSDLGDTDEADLSEAQQMMLQLRKQLGEEEPGDQAA
jgi:hypothetical protein